LLTHPGVGRIVALAFSLTIGPVDRFPSSKHLVSYFGAQPERALERWPSKLWAISKQENRLIRTLLVEAAQTAARVEPTLCRHYQRLKFRRPVRLRRRQSLGNWPSDCTGYSGAKLTRRSWFVCKAARGLTWWTYINRFPD
jgi:transposase